MSRRTCRRITFVAIATVLVATLMPVSQAAAWKMKTHAYSANLVLDEVTASGGTVVIPPYGTFAVRPEFYDAITSYPRAYRAGAIGPDGYPDMYIGQAFIHPAPVPAGGTYSDEWLQQQWATVRLMPPGEPKKEALAFLLGYLTHSAGDLFGHDYINELSGGEFPAIADALNSDELQNIIVRHNVTEAYIDDAIPAAFTASDSEYMKIEAPQAFVVDSLLTNGGVAAGPNTLLYRFDELPYHLAAAYATRAWVAGELASLTRRISSPSIEDLPRLQYLGLKYLYFQAWLNDIDEAVTEWAATNQRVAQALLIDDLDTVKLELREWAIHHGIKMTPAPDIVSDQIGDAVDFGDWIADFMPESIENWISDFKDEQIYDRMTRRTYATSLEDIKAITGDPAGYLDGRRTFHGYVLFQPGIRASMDAYMGNYDEMLANGSDSTFPPFRNTVTMAKLILIGKEGQNELLQRSGCSAGLLYPNPMLGFMRTLDGSTAWENGKTMKLSSTAPSSTVHAALYDYRNVWCSIFTGFDPGINNPSFEEEWKADGVPMEWRLGSNSGGVAVASSPGHTDAHAVRIVNPGTTAAQRTFIMTPFVAAPERRFTISAWVKSARTPGSVEMQVQFWNADNTRITESVTTGDEWGVNGSEWRRMSITATAPAGSAVGKLILGTRGSGVTADAYFDDVEFASEYRVGALTFWPAGGAHPVGTVVRIIASSEGVEIHYTTDGSEPTRSSPLYVNEVRLSAPGLIRARGFKDGATPSEIASVQYGVTPRPVNISPSQGTYNDPIQVWLTSQTGGAQIRYTLDGSTPTTSSALFAGPFTLNRNTTVKARAYKEGYIPSAVTSANYVINDSAVVVDPPGGAFTSSPVRVTMSCGVPGARIYFSTAGALPTKYTSRYTGSALSIRRSQTIKARALRPDGSWGPLTTVNFLVNTSRPYFTPSARTFTGPQTVRIRYPVPNARIHYTIDGSVPGTDSPVYTAPLTIDRTTTLNARALFGGTTWSPLRTGVFTISYPSPYFTPRAGSYSSMQRVAIRHATPGARIFYTVDGSMPTTESPPYSTPIEIPVTTTLKTRALFGEDVWSPVRTGTFTIRVLTPSFSPAAGTYYGQRAVKMTFPTPGATIFYTTDGTEPDQTSPRYSAPVTIDATTTLKARALVGAGTWSGTKTGEYRIRYYAPSFSPNGGTYSAAKSVTMTHSTPGSKIYYTTDGSEPNASCQLYQGSVTISESCVLKARALINGRVWSPVRSATFTIGTAVLTAPTFSPYASASGTVFTSMKSVTITYAADPSAPIHYTTDGSEPTEASARYTEPITIDTTTTLKARARVGSAWTPTRTGVYNIRYPAPSFSLSSGTYTPPKTITIRYALMGVAIYYTVDGSDPMDSASRVAYSAPVTLTESCTLKARALVNGHAWSALKSAVYTMRVPTATVVGAAGRMVL